MNRNTSVESTVSLNYKFRKLSYGFNRYIVLEFSIKGFLFFVITFYPTKITLGYCC